MEEQSCLGGGELCKERRESGTQGCRLIVGGVALLDGGKKGVRCRASLRARDVGSKRRESDPQRCRIGHALLWIEGREEFPGGRLSLHLRQVLCKDCGRLEEGAALKGVGGTLEGGERLAGQRASRGLGEG